ncbi:MAG: hypothetical protein BGO13_07025 [Burkholderiales bacterium 66-5]|nr:MAG: hypothetical protein BGO13_07025 [Burkholderiales bacterium 66-5]
MSTTTELQRAQERVDSAAVAAALAYRPIPRTLDDALIDDSLPYDGLPLAAELALSRRFIAAAGGRLRWSPGMDWMIDRGTHWERDTLLQRFAIAKRVCTEAAQETDKEPLAAKICAASTVAAIIGLARSDGTIATPVARWDSEPMILNTPGGAIDLETGREVSRDGLLFTQTTSAAPRRMATPRWSQFLQEVFAGDAPMIEFIQRLAGYALTGSIREQTLFFLHGTGANGKSVFLDILRAIGGSYAYNLPSEALMSSRQSGHPTMLAALQGKRIAVSSEVEEGSHWSEARIKSLTGDETLTARFMRQDFFEFRLTSKHVIGGNYKPRLRGDDFAMVRRLVLIPFAQRFEGARRDDNLTTKLKAELPGILQWAIDGAVKWARDGLAIPESVANASQQYASEQNDLELWMAECCERSPGATTSSAVLYASFKAWKEASGERAPSNKSFGQRLERLFEKRRIKAGSTFDGITLAAGADLFTDGQADA